MPREIANHEAVIEALRESEVLAELLQKHEGHFEYELDLELVVYGRTYAGKKVGPYARLLVFQKGEEIIHEGEWGGNTFYVLVRGNLDVHVDDENGVSRKVGEIGPQTIFGEMSVLAGQPRNATVLVSTDAEARVLEITRPALRILRKLKMFGARLDRTYRQHGLDRTLLQVQESTHNSFSPELLTKLKSAARFSVHPKNHLLFQEGDPIEKLVFINNGWVRRVRGLAKNPMASRILNANPILADQILSVDAEIGLDFLGAGSWLGLECVASRETSAWAYTATCMARTEVLEIAVSDLRADPILAKLISIEFPNFSEADDGPPRPPADRRTVNAAAKEISTGIVDATNLLVMDMDLCIRCGNCSLACHKVHGRSRLLRHGIHISRPLKPNGNSIQHVLMPAVCLHCQDAECLTGCPTGAIARFDKGHIDIDVKTCIGCADCATQCPYNAITMVPRHAEKAATPSFPARLRNWLTLSVPEGPAAVTATEDLIAVKCNLCENTTLNPGGSKKPAYSCQENCPTGALVRVNPREYFSEAKNAIGIVFQDQTHAIGRNIHKRDVPALIVHAISVIAILTISSIVLLAARRHGLNEHLRGTWLTLRWITGLLGLGGIAGAVTYSARKQIYTRRVGPLRYWKLVHVYLGVLAGVLLLIHGGRDSGGLLTSALMVSFDVTIVAGLFGVACYFLVPRIMTSIEGDPLLIEDLRARRQELREQLALLDTSDDQLRLLITKKIRKRFFSLGYLLEQYLKREELTKVLARGREEFRDDAARLSGRAAYVLMEAVEATATLRRVDSLIYLHQLLKLWLAPHVVAASIMLALMLVHITQVVLFTVR